MGLHVNGGYPYSDGCAVPSGDALVQPYPYSCWRVNGFTNGGMPFKMCFGMPLPVHAKPPTQYPPIRVYAATETDFDHNGMAILMPTSCTVAEELNGMYECELSHPLDQDGVWKRLIEFNVIRVQGQLFRIYAKKTTDTERSVNARHIFYDLNAHFLLDTRPTDLDGQNALTWILGHTYTPRGTAETADAPPFTAFSDITDVHTAYYQKMSVTASLLGTENCFVNVWGGELKRDNFNIYINKQRGESNAFQLRYGCDMTAITETIDCTDYCPCVYWDATVGGVDDYLRGVSAYRQINLPVQPMQYLHVTVDELITGSEAINAEITRQVKEHVAGNCMPSVNYDVDVVDLRGVDGYADFVGLSAYGVGDTGIIFSETLGISTVQQIIKRTTNGITGDVISVELGNLRKSIVSRSGKTVGTYQFEQQRANDAAKNTYKHLGQELLYTYAELKNTTYAELAGKVLMKYDD